MMDELWREEEKKTLERIAKLTELGKIKWECVEYNPLCFMNEDKVDETSAYLCQMFTLTSEIGGMPYELEIAEYITVPDGKGDMNIPSEMVLSDRAGGACRPQKWCSAAVCMVHSYGFR